MPKSITPAQDEPQEPIKREPTQMTYKDAVQYIVDSLPIMSRSAVAKALNEEGVRDAKGRKWNLHRVEEAAEANSELEPSWTKPTTPKIDILKEIMDGTKPLFDDENEEEEFRRQIAARAAFNKEHQQ